MTAMSVQRGKIMLTIIQQLSDCKVLSVELESLFGAFLNVPGGKPLVVVNSALDRFEQFLVKEWLLNAVLAQLAPDDMRWSLPIQVYCHSLPLPPLHHYVATRFDRPHPSKN